MTNHTEVLNYIIEKKQYKSFLEIGVQNGRNYHALNCEHKVGVDPDPISRATHKMTSNEFFKQNEEKFDLIFIDGEHTAQQVKKDFINSMSVLNPEGIIVIHDTNPGKEEWTKIPRETKQWTGDVYKFACSLIAEAKTLPFDYGITVVKNSEYVFMERDFDWQHFVKFRAELLSLCDLNKFKEWL